MSGKKRKKKTLQAGRIALCMIVRDEEANLERCLQSVRGLVSEINIVDTGSADGTVQVARRLGARVRETKWNNDFSRARNISLKMARTEWILVLDADEVLSPDAVAAIKVAIQNRDIAGYLLPTRNYLNDSSVGNFVPNDGSFEPARHCRGWVESRKVRLFRKRPGICFEGEIHEVIGPSIRRSGGRTEFLNAVVHHFGFLASENSLRRKNEMMARLAEAKCAGRPDDYKAHYELGVILARLGNLKEAEQSFRKSIVLRNDFALSHYDLGVVLSRMGREEDAVEQYGAALELDPNSIDAMNNLADSLQRLRRDAEAERVYRRLLERHPSYSRSWNNLGALLASGGRLEEAEKAFRQALRIDPDFSDARQNLQQLERLKSREQPFNPSPRSRARFRPGISLCMIVRNEAENLPGMLEHIRDAVDEIIVVDTGSTDGTRSIAESAGANVYDFRWGNDFAAARNFALSKAACDWILILDADEALGAGNAGSLRTLVQDTGALGFSFETRNYSCDSSLQGWRPVRRADEMARSFPGWFPSEKVRLFRNRPQIRFEGAIHELVEPSIVRAGGSIERAGIPIHHYGYDRVCEKAEAYLEPAAQKARANPEDPQTQFELGAVLHRLGKFEGACEALAKAAELAPGHAEYLVALGDSLRAAGRASESEAAYLKALGLRPDLSSARRGLGIVLFNQGKIAASRRAFEEALRLCPHDAQSLTNIGVIAAQVGSTDEAAEYFKRALEINPRSDIARNNLQTLSAASTRPPSLGLLMIVRNERDNLGELLPALASCFDEIVIVDTGSVDGTAEVSKKYTDKVFTFQWADDFSATRNFGLTKMQADWVLWLDADDRMKPEEVASLRKHMAGNDRAYLLRVVSGIDGSGMGEFLQLRLFPNIEGIRWEGRVHEQLLPSVERRGLSVETLAEVAIVHKGYNDPARLAEKSRRNLSLLEMERTSRPGDPYVLQHLAQAYGLLGEIERAIEVSEALVNARTAQTPDEFLAHSMNRLIQYSLILNDIEKAKQWADRVIVAYPRDRLVRYFLGEIRYREKKPREAIGWFEQFVDEEDTIGCVPVPWETLSANARNFLGVLYEQIGRRDRAHAAFRDAIRQGARVEAHKNLARMLLEDGEPAEAESVLRAAVEMSGGDAVVWTNLGAALARSGKLREAADVCRRALEIDPANEAARQNLVRIEQNLRETPHLARSFTLSACIIAKDEAERLREAIESVAPVCDEVIVVDTGSTDNTAEVARNCGAVVETFEWGDDFSAARNFSLGRARSEWILVIDADEIVASPDLKKLAALKPDSGVWGYSMTTRNYSADREVIGWRPVEPSDDLARGMPGWLPSTKVRLFRNLPEIRFEGRIHECVEPSILRAGGRIESLDVPVHHYGYIRSDEAKRRRYLEMAEAKARENRGDSRAHFELGVQRMVVGNIEGAAEAFSRAITLDPDNELALLNLAGAKIRLRKFAEARQILERALALNPNSACAHYNLGVALEKLELFAEAGKEFSRALAIDPHDSGTLAKLGYLEARGNNFAAARDYLEKALEIDPANRHARNNLEYVRKKASAFPAGGCDLSLNMIVRDEEKNIKEGLTPIAGLFDEVVIVDTGSRDGTAATAEALGARVVRHPWNDSFADARNAALRNSNGKWIFWLDADDRIEPDAVRTLRKFIARGIPCGVFFPLESAIGGDGPVVRNNSLRLFPNTPGIEWTGAVHEQIATSLRDAGIELVNCPDFTIRHTGYEKEGESLKKNLRNLKLLAKELAERPEDPYVLFALAQAFLFCGQADHARKWLGVLWKLREKANGAASDEVFWMAAVTLSDCELKSGNAREANAWLERAIECFPDNWVAYFLLGEKKLAAGDLERAAALLGRAAEIGITPTLLPLDIDDMRGKLGRYLSELEKAGAWAKAI